MEIEIDGEKVITELDFHRELARVLDVQEFYGYNLDALWDLLSAGVDRPVRLVWRNSEVSKQRMGLVFERIQEILERVTLQDEKFGWEDKFTYLLC